MRIKATSLFMLALVTSGFVSARDEDKPELTSVQVEPSQFALGGKWSSQTHVTVKDSQNDSVYFLSHVMPLINKLGCNQCHGSLSGKGGFRLSMFGADPEFDYAALTKFAEGRRVNKAEPLQSLFLLKATASISHKGGQKIEVGSPEYNLLASWVAQGARWAGENEPDLVSIKVFPEEKILQKGETQQLLATAVFSDGTEKDVTRYASFESSPGKVAAVEGNGKVKADDFGQSAVIVTYLRHSATARVVVPQPLPFPFPEVEANNKIDELVFAKLKELGIPPSELCGDHEFLRRVYLDVIGTLPTADEARAFLSDSDPQKRSKLIDRLLEGEEFADFWALKWGDLLRIKSEYPSNLWPNAVQAYHRWIRDSIAKNKPYDQFATELLTSSGSNFRVPPANYYRAFLKREPQNLAEVTALVFMGARIGCARCHAHPSENWTLEDNLGLAGFFAGVRFKRTQEWKEEIVYINPKQTIRHPRTNELVQPKFLGGEVLELKAEEDPRVKFAQWLTAADNPWFARNIVNRTWFWLLGRGIVHEVDDLRPTNPPENPELLEYLEKELVSHDFDLKHIYRLILNSRTYQLSAKSNQWNQNDIAHFSHYQVKRLGAETLLDAIGQVTERWDTYQSRIPEPFVRMPRGFRATHLADGSIGIPFLELFGRPPRDTAFESDRDLRLSMRQTLHLLNSSDVQNKINASPRLKRLISQGKEDAELIEEIYLAVLSRSPTEEEGRATLEYLSGKSGATLEQAQAEKKAAEEALAKVKGELEKAKADYGAAETAAKEALAAAVQAKAAVAKAAAAQADAQKLAAAKRQQANEAEKKLDDLVQDRQKSAEADLAAAAKSVTDATTAKAALDQPLAEAQAATAKAEQAYRAAEEAAQEAEARAKAISEDAGKSEEEKKQAATEAAAKRKLADEGKTALTQAEQNEQQAQSQVAAAAQKLAEAEAQKKSAEQALANVKNQVAAATEASQAAEKAVEEAAAAAGRAKAEADKAPAAQMAAEKAAAEKRKLAEEAKAKRDKLVGDEKAAHTKLAQADKKVGAAHAPRTAAQRRQALQDVLWALLNTKEFLFNH